MTTSQFKEWKLQGKMILMPESRYAGTLGTLIQNKVLELTYNYPLRRSWGDQDCGSSEAGDSLCPRSGVPSFLLEYMDESLDGTLGSCSSWICVVSIAISFLRLCSDRSRSCRSSMSRCSIRNAFEITRCCRSRSRWSSCICVPHQMVFFGPTNPYFEVRWIFSCVW